MVRDSEIAIGLLLPDILGTYGDNGNARVLAKRLEWRGIPSRVLSIDMATEVPSSCDVYVMGGGEDECQSLATRRLRSQPGFRAALDRGAVLLAICAGFQIIGTTFTSTTGQSEGGLELVEMDTVAAVGPRSVGELALRPATALLTSTLTGFENHQGHTNLGAGVEPLGTVRSGIGNGNGVDGALRGHVVGTYLHGPALARNPELADLLLTWAVGEELAPLPLDEVAQLRRERLAAVGAADPT